MLQAWTKITCKLLKKLMRAKSRKLLTKYVDAQRKRRLLSIRKRRRKRAKITPGTKLSDLCWGILLANKSKTVNIVDYLCTSILYSIITRMDALKLYSSFFIKLITRIRLKPSSLNKQNHKRKAKLKWLDSVKFAIRMSLQKFTCPTHFMNTQLLDSLNNSFIMETD